MADEIIYKGGELDSVRVISGAAVATTSYRDSEYSAMSIVLSGSVLAGDFRSPSDGSLTNVTGGDVLWSSFYVGLGSAVSGTWWTVFDAGGRAAFRLNVQSSTTLQLQHNTSATTSPSWIDLSSFSGAGGLYLAFRIKTGADKEFGFYVNGVLISEGDFSNSYIGALSNFRIGSLNSPNAAISQIQFSRNIPLVHARLYTRKATAAGTYQQMTGAYTNIVKTSLNDATGLVSDTVGQITTNQYQDVIVPAGMEMHPDVWIWNRVRNDGGEPSSMKQACIVNSVMQKSDDLPVDIGFQCLPHVLRSMTPALWNSCEVGQESTTP